MEPRRATRVTRSHQSKHVEAVGLVESREEGARKAFPHALQTCRKLRLVDEGSFVRPQSACLASRRAGTSLAGVDGERVWTEACGGWEQLRHQM